MEIGGFVRHEDPLTLVRKSTNFRRLSNIWEQVGTTLTSIKNPTTDMKPSPVERLTESRECSYGEGKGAEVNLTTATGALAPIFLVHGLTLGLGHPDILDLVDRFSKGILPTCTLWDEGGFL